MERCSRLVSTVLLIGVLTACGGTEDESPTAEPSPPEPLLVEIHPPHLEPFEPAVREQLTDALARVGDLRDGDAPAPALGQAFADLARSYHAYELHDSAVEAYRNAEALLPSDFRWPAYLGHVYRHLARLDESRAAFDRALELRPDSAPLLVAAGGVLRETGELDRAEAVVRKALEIDPRSGAGLLLLAEIALDRQQWSAAIERYEALLALQPAANLLYRPLATAYRQLGESSTAEALLQRAGQGAVVARDPLIAELEGFKTGVRADLEVGKEAFKLRDYERAAAAFRRAVAADPGNLEAHMALGSALLRNDDAAGALRHYEEAARLEPGRAEPHFHIGVVKSRSGDVEGAIESYRRALEIDPAYRDPRFNLANALRRGGRCPEARRHYLHLIDATPTDGPARLGEAVCLVDEERWAEARRRLKEALQAIPRSRTLANAGARLLAASPDQAVRDGQQALRLARQLLQVDQRPEYSETLAMALAEVGEFDEAIDIQRQLLTGAESRNLEALLPRLRRNLELYEQGLPCREPAIAEVSSLQPHRGGA